MKGKLIFAATTLLVILAGFTPALQAQSSSNERQLLRRNRCAGCDLRDVIIRNANLVNAGLGGANLSGASLRNTNLSGANLRNANLRNADLSGASLRGADLFYADLEDANLSGVSLERARLCGTTMPDGSESRRDCGRDEL